MSRDLEAHAWLRYAKEDLDAAELLLKSRFYRHALFWVEQASEKILKVYIIAPHVKELISKLDSIIDHCKSPGINNEDIEKLKKLRNKIIEFLNPKKFQHICGKKIKEVENFFDMYREAISHPYVCKALRESSDIRKRMSVNRYRKVFREVEKLIGKAVKTIQTQSMPRCEEPDASYIVQLLQNTEERADEVRKIISNIAQETLQKYKGDEIAEQAILDCCCAYLTFLDEIAVMPYFELHAYICQFFEITRYPGDRGIPKDVIDNMPRIISLLRKNLERVKRLVVSNIDTSRESSG